VRLLREAKTWIFIGYSMPAADFEFKNLPNMSSCLGSSRQKSILFTGGSGAKETHQKYQKFFGPQLGTSSASYLNKGLTVKPLRTLRRQGH
jgi:hypothetical protein